jgi:hypothetical protein
MMAGANFFNPIHSIFLYIKANSPGETEAIRGPVGIRTPNLRIRSAMLYPVELQNRNSEVQR